MSTDLAGIDVEEYELEQREKADLATIEAETKYLVSELMKAAADLRRRKGVDVRKRLSQILLVDEKDLRHINEELFFSRKVGSLDQSVDGTTFRTPFSKLFLKMKKQGVEVLQLDEETLRELGEDPDVRLVEKHIKRMERLAFVEFVEAERAEKLLRGVKRPKRRTNPIEYPEVSNNPDHLEDPQVKRMIALDIPEEAHTFEEDLGTYVAAHPAAPLVDTSGRYNKVIVVMLKKAQGSASIKLGKRLVRTKKYVDHPDEGGYDYTDKLAFFFFFQHCGDELLLKFGIESFMRFLQYAEQDRNPRVTNKIRGSLISSFTVAINTMERHYSEVTDPRLENLQMGFNHRWRVRDWERLISLIVSEKRIPTFVYRG